MNIEYEQHGTETIVKAVSRQENIPISIHQEVFKGERIYSLTFDNDPNSWSYSMEVFPIVWKEVGDGY